MECRIPMEKIIKLKSKLDYFKHRKKVTLKEIHSLIGLLNFACSVVVPGRAFLRRLINLTCNIRSQNFYVSLNKDSRADLQTWSYFIDSFNGKSVFLDLHRSSSEHLKLWTDASCFIGFAAVLGTSWFASHWPESLGYYQISVKELFPIVLALEIWSFKFHKKKVLFLSDNNAVVDIINKQNLYEIDKTFSSGFFTI
jgi:hypothetical protein